MANATGSIETARETMSKSIEEIVLIDGNRSGSLSGNTFTKLKQKLSSLRFVLKTCSNDFSSLSTRTAAKTLVMIVNKNGDFGDKEVQKLHQFLNAGALVLVAFGDCYVRNEHSNDAKFFTEFAIQIDTNFLIRSHHFKYHNPRHCFLNDAATVLEPLRKQFAAKNQFGFVYPLGFSFDVRKPSFTVMSSGACTIPANRSIAVCCTDRFQNDGKLFVFGSSSAIADEFLANENNWSLLEAILKFLQLPNATITRTIAAGKEIDTNDSKLVPDVIELSEKPKSHLGESVKLLNDFDYLTLIDDRLHSMHSLKSVENIRRLRKDLHVEQSDDGDCDGDDHQSLLGLIAPKFQSVLPSFVPAVYGPIGFNIEPHTIPVFDLDNDDDDSVTNLSFVRVSDKYAASSADTATVPKSIDSLENFVFGSS